MALILWAVATGLVVAVGVHTSHLDLA